MGTSVGLEVMRMLAEGDYETEVAAKGAYFLDGLRELQKRWPQIGDVDGLGLALRAEICEADGWTPNKALLDQMAEEGMKGDLEVNGKRHGLILDVGGYHKNVITLAPSLHISREEIDLALQLLDQLLRRCVRS
jgi:4-aminobutyrate aminotransferase-like enzyme